MQHKYRTLLVSIGVSLLLLLVSAPRIRAQGYPPGFDMRLEWEFYEEQSKDGQEVDVSQGGARIGYSLPQTFDIFVALSW